MPRVAFFSCVYARHQHVVFLKNSINQHSKWSTRTSKNCRNRCSRYLVFRKIESAVLIDFDSLSYLFSFSSGSTKKFAHQFICAYFIYLASVRSLCPIYTRLWPTCVFWFIYYTVYCMRAVQSYDMLSRLFFTPTTSGVRERHRGTKGTDNFLPCKVFEL